MMKQILSTLVAFIFTLGCKKQVFVADTGLNSASHGNGFAANYTVVFPQDKVNRLDIVFKASEWSAMQSNLADVTNGGGGPGQFSSENPDYFHCQLNFNGLTWNNVGIRYKGNSSLRARSGKLPLRLEFDHWEDDFPETKNQRFYGFKELSLSSNYDDASLMREKSACDLFRDFGVPAVRTAFYEIYIDMGTGSYQYFGVYTMQEIIGDTYLQNGFGSESGNCYKPDGDGAMFASTGFTLDDFELKTNELANDKSDIQVMYDVLHSPLRNTDKATWKKNLESVFDVDGFLKYLAVNNTIQNWDTYGRMTHNYYLYHDPADGLIKWIVWDNNEAFQDGKRGGSLSFAMTEVGTDWPLINYIIEDADYETTYKKYILEFVNTSFENSRMNTIYSNQQSLLYNSANKEETGYSYLNGIGGFTNAVGTLKSHNSSRISAAKAYAQ